MIRASTACAADDQHGAAAPGHRRARVVARHRAGLGQPARDGLLPVLQPVKRGVREAHLLLRRGRGHLSAARPPPPAPGRPPAPWPRLRRGHHAGIAGVAALASLASAADASARRLPHRPRAASPSPPGAASGGGRRRRRRRPAQASRPGTRLDLGVAAGSSGFRAFGIFHRHRARTENRLVHKSPVGSGKWRGWEPVLARRRARRPEPVRDRRLLLTSTQMQRPADDTTLNRPPSVAPTPPGRPARAPTWW